MNTTAEIQSYTVKEEILHSSIHAVGILIGLTSIVFLVTHPGHYSSGYTARIIYCSCFLLTFLVSTLYHIINNERLKDLFKIADHITIYFLIGGAYTAFILIYMNNRDGITMLTIVWCGAAIGVLLKIFFVERAQILSVCFYLFLGLFFLFDAKNFFAPVPLHIARLIVAGVILYVTGVTFYLWKGWKYHHAVWHLFTLAASLCHLVAVLY